MQRRGRYIPSLQGIIQYWWFNIALKRYVIIHQFLKYFVFLLCCIIVLYLILIVLYNTEKYTISFWDLNFQYKANHNYMLLLLIVTKKYLIQTDLKFQWQSYFKNVLVLYQCFLVFFFYGIRSLLVYSHIIYYIWDIWVHSLIQCNNDCCNICNVLFSIIYSKLLNISHFLWLTKYFQIPSYYFYIL